ncbi:MAG: hypothetical protein ABSF69_27445 [Polyangiaceae bacterium]
MRPKRMALLLIAPIAVFSAFASVPVRADATLTKDQCIDANGEGQELRREGQFSAARGMLLLCANQSCPAIVRDDCTTRLDELEKAQPTIAFQVKDASGGDVSAVRVTVDGKLLTDLLDGTALRVDVGHHAFTFEIAGQPPVTRTLVITEGVKGRREVVTMGAAGLVAPMSTTGASPAATPGSDAERPATSGTMATQKVLGMVTGGVGLAGLALGGVFGLLTLSEKKKQQNDCPSFASCTISGHSSALTDHSNGMTDGTISTAASIAGAALLVGGAVLVFTAGSARNPPAITGVLVSPGVVPGGGGMLLRGVF